MGAKVVALGLTETAALLSLMIMGGIRGATAAIVELL